MTKKTKKAAKKVAKKIEPKPIPNLTFREALIKVAKKPK